MRDAASIFAGGSVSAVRKRSVSVAVKFAVSLGKCETIEGPVRYRVGDAIITGPAGEHWPVSRDAFLAVYRPVVGTTVGCNGYYLKVRNHAHAVHLAEEVLLTLGPLKDTVRGNAGDWLLKYDDGSFGIVENAIFNATYEPI